MRIGVSIARLLAASAFTFIIMWVYMRWLAAGMSYSIWVLLTIWLAMVAVCLIFQILFHAYHYALNVEPELQRNTNRGQQSVLKPPFFYEGAQRDNIAATIRESTSDRVLTYLEKHIALYSSNTYIVRSSELFNIQKIKHYRFDTVLNLMPLNQIRGINKMFAVVNDKLPDDGLFVCCVMPQEVVKRNIMKKFPPLVNFVVYSSLFLYKRVLPKLFMTSRLYYDITEGKNRMLSLAEVLGRLCYCGFEILDEHKMGDYIYIVARRSFTPQTVQRRLYGMFVSLDRVGKGGKTFTVYKFRTMHPYAEYLQEYIYNRNSLQEGGKFKHDIRITTLGRFLRSCWLDELPMILNMLKGDIKLVGVRPISRQYYSLYSKELQQKRTLHRPGLLPPFYADMPKTLDEIQASEMKYLTACEQRGTLPTDFIYFWKILFNITFRHARSK